MWLAGLLASVGILCLFVAISISVNNVQLLNA